jgi:hypothetical protein
MTDVILETCGSAPTITNARQAHHVMQVHAHYPSAPCPARRAALQWLSDYGGWVLSSRFAAAP